MASVRRLAAASLASSAAALALLACTTAVSPLPESEQRAQAIDNSLICPICPGETIDRSQVQLAKDMQVIVRELIAEGRSDEEILQFFVDRYGERVLAAPPREGFHWLVWGLPPAGMALGLLALFWVTQLMGRRPTEAQDSTLRQAQGERGDADLSPYLQQVERELGDGGPSDEWRGSRLRGNDGLEEDA
ncbi:MAG: cytochrome c-type biogenesis protein CcmH [Chloroflexota bacterium]|nr:cytochrome c-type biogenesis protein CcmH [Chloroflexota bacterium]MDE2968954.1 cytochrome c-type biogenesis protein CcmH [Chloroflexota bacterium]